MKILCTCQHEFEADKAIPWIRCPRCCGIIAGPACPRESQKLVDALRDISSAGILRWRDAGVMNEAIKAVIERDILKQRSEGCPSPSAASSQASAESKV
jgi:hypothetical protein